MTQHRKARGRQTEHLVADYLRERGWPYAEAVGAGRPGADITGTPDLAVEVKGRRGFNPKAALEQAHANADGRLPFAVLRLDGQGPASIDDWPVVIRLGEFVKLLRAAGYGDGHAGRGDYDRGFTDGYNAHARSVLRARAEYGGTP